METIQIQLPHKFTPRSYQLPFLKAMDDGFKRAVLVWHRRSGKDKTSFNFLIKRMYERIGSYYYFFPTKEEAKKVIWEGIGKDGMPFLEHFPKELIENNNETEKKIVLKNGSIFRLAGTDDYNDLMGINPVGIVFSEYSLQKPQAWNFFRPILAENDGWAVFEFTPRGMNHAHDLLLTARENSDKWFSQILTVEDTQAINAEILLQEKKEMPQDLYDQEFYCKFIEGAGAFFRNIRSNIYVEDLRPDPTHKYKMGVDLGKHQDYTVLTILDLMTFKIVEIERFNQIDWNLQKAKIEAMYLRYWKPEIIMDSTGLGDPIFDDLLNRGIKNIYPYKFTETTRKDLLVNLQLKLEQNKIKIPENELLIDELNSMRYELVGDRGKTVIRVPENLHDDMIFSLALSVWEIPQNPMPKPTSLKFLSSMLEDKQEQTSYE